MIEISTIEIAGFRSALMALRLPFGKDCRSMTSAYYNFYPASINGFDRWIETNTASEVSDKDLSLMTALVKGGDCEAKVLRGIVVYADIKAPMDWWSELETYRAGHERLSSESKMHTIYKGLSGDALEKARKETSATYPLEKIDMFSYQCLRNIYIWRRNHRLPEWIRFCDWIESLPYAEKLITVGIDDDA